MLLHCPECNQSLRAEDVNLDNLSAKCSHCDHIFFFDREGKAARPEPAEKAPVELPDGMSMRKMLSQLELRYSWRRQTSGFLVFFGIFWNILLFPFVAVAVIQMEWMILIFISAHLAVGVGLLYYILAGFFNATYITVTPAELKVENTPLPIPFNPSRTLSASQVEQVYVKKYSSGKTNGQPTWAYAVEVILKNQASIRLVKGLKTAEYGLFIEQEIEKFLNISDRQVKEEWTGNYA